MATGAREWKQANRKEVTLPSGRVAVIRKLTSEFLLTMQEINDDLLALPAQRPPSSLPPLRI